MNSLLYVKKRILTILPIAFLPPTTHTRSITPNQLREMPRCLTEPRRFLPIILQFFNTPRIYARRSIIIARC